MKSYRLEDPSKEPMIRAQGKDPMIYCALICSCIAAVLAVWSVIMPPATPLATATPPSTAQPLTAGWLHAKDNIDQFAASFTALQNKIDILEQRTRRLQVAAESQVDSADTAVASHDEIHTGLDALADMDSTDGAAGSATTIFQQRFALEPIDSGAGYEVEETVNQLFTQQQIVNTGLQLVDCYETGCWLEFDHLDGIADEDFIEILQDNELFAGEFYIETQTDASGFSRTIVVMDKPGLN